MSVTWCKIRRDLLRIKFRTFLVVLSTAVGLFALGFVYGTSDVLRTRLTESYQASLPSHLTFYTSIFQPELVDTLRREPGVADAEGMFVASIRWKLEGEKDWRNGTVIARPDYDAQRLNLYELVRGVWPDQSLNKRALAVERLSANYWMIPVGGEIIVESGRDERRLPIEGIVRHPQAAQPPLGEAVFFATPETATWLTDHPDGLSRFYVRLESFTPQGAKQAGKQLEDRLRGMDLSVYYYAVTDPNVHPAQQQLDALLVVMMVLGALALGLCAFLIVNMMNALVAQQVWQIGVMKVIGATSWRVVRVYLAMALIYGLLSLLLAVPLGAIGAHLLAARLLELFNVEIGAFHFVPAAAGAQVAVGLIVPLLAALAPVIGGARITAHQAINSYGLGAGFGSNWLDRLIGAIRRLPRPMALSLRNTFRRKSRIALTLVTLVLGGAMFIGVMSVGASLNNTLEVLLGDFGFDMLVAFERAYRIERLVEVTQNMPGVTRAEVWDRQPAQLKLAGGEDREVFLWGVPPDSKMFKPRMASGRALQPGDNRAIVLNLKIATDENIGVGDVITLTMNGQESSWDVVGLAINVNNLQRDNFVPNSALAREWSSLNRGGLVMLTAEKHDAKFLQQLTRDLRATYAAAHLESVQFQSTADVREQNQAQFNIITYLMLVMAVLAAAVGSIGLMSTMSVNVVERSREIGVMRSIGATSAAILGVFLFEGVLVGVLSWLIAVPLSYPGARLLSDMVGNAFKLPLDFDFSLPGVVTWFVIVVMLSALASLWPALRATRVSVREALSYE